MQIMQPKGFTLLELLVVIGIIASLMVILLPGFNAFNRSQTLKNTALELQTVLRKTQNHALSGVKCNSTTSAASWSIKFFNNTSYELETVCSSPAVSPTPAPSLVARYSLPGGVSINGFVKDDGTSPCTLTLTSNPVRIIFSNISAEVNFDDSNSGCLLKDAKKLTILLQLDSDTENSINVIVEKGGAIYVKSQ